MHPSVSLDRTLVAVQVGAVVHVMLELAAPPAPAAARPPFDVVLVLDRSGSMSGDPLRAVKEATVAFARLLGPEDRLAVVAFDDSARLVLPLRGHGADRVAAALGAVDPGGSTNLSGGWLKGLEILGEEGRRRAVRRIVVLTDGHANVGITDPAMLTALAGSARGQGITTTAIGFADGHDEQLLAAVADAGGGNDYWCAGADHAPQVFGAEFEGLASVVAQNLSVEVRPGPDVAGCAVLNEFPVTQVQGGLQVALGDAYGGERRRVVAQLELRPQAAVGDCHLGELVIRWVSTLGDVEMHTVEVPVSIAVTDDPDAPSGVDPEVSRHVTLLRAAKERRAATERLRQSDPAAAAAHLRRAADLLESSGDPSQWGDVRELRRDADALERGVWDESTTKRHFSSYRTAQRGRRTRFDS